MSCVASELQWSQWTTLLLPRGLERVLLAQGWLAVRKEFCLLKCSGTLGRCRSNHQLRECSLQEERATLAALWVRWLPVRPCSSLSRLQSCRCWEKGRMGIGGLDPFLAPSFIVCGFECSQTVDISCFLSIIWVGWGWGARGCCPVGFLGCLPP